MDVFDGKNWISFFSVPYFWVLPMCFALDEAGEDPCWLIVEVCRKGWGEQGEDEAGERPRKTNDVSVSHIWSGIFLFKSETGPQSGQSFGRRVWSTGTRLDGFGLFCLVADVEFRTKGMEHRSKAGWVRAVLPSSKMWSPACAATSSVGTRNWIRPEVRKDVSADEEGAWDWGKHGKQQRTSGCWSQILWSGLLREWDWGGGFWDNFWDAVISRCRPFDGPGPLRAHTLCLCKLMPPLLPAWCTWPFMEMKRWKSHWSVLPVFLCEGQWLPLWEAAKAKPSNLLMIQLFWNSTRMVAHRVCRSEPADSSCSTCRLRPWFGYFLCCWRFQKIPPENWVGIS